MQIRPHDEGDGYQIWLEPEEQGTVLNTALNYDTDRPQRLYLASALGFHGVRACEMASDENNPIPVRRCDVNDIGGGAYTLTVATGKSGRRRTPISECLAHDIKAYAQKHRLRAEDPIIDVKPQQVRTWMTWVRAELPFEHAEDLTMHDARRTWATETIYLLALHHVPIAESLVMSWGGWKQTQSGRDTFREHYLGPVPQYLTQEFHELATRRQTDAIASAVPVHQPGELPMSEALDAWALDD